MAKKSSAKKSQKKNPTLIGGILLLVVVFIVVAGMVLWNVLPTHFRNPEVAHHHFRMQLFIEGEYIDFSKAPYQEAYEPGICSDGLTDTPIHFHDEVGQYVHIHWTNIRGGDVLKYYGLNRIGGADDILGYRFDLDGIQSIPTLTDAIPDSDNTLWVYQVNDDEIIERSARDFLLQDLETFFGVKSSLTLQREEAENEFSNFLSVTASAHPNHGSEDIKQVKNDFVLFDDEEEQFTEEELKDLNDVLGDVLIFVQDDEPSEEVIQERIPKFVDLPQSTCGG